MDNYRPGDPYLICDRTGRKMRLSDSRKEWTGAVVHKDSFEARHPQDFVRGRRDQQAVPGGRPEPLDTFMGPLATEIAASSSAGATTITVLSTARMESGDRLSIMLDNNDAFFAFITTVLDSEQILLASPLPHSVSAGQAVIDMSAIAEADTG